MAENLLLAEDLELGVLLGAHGHLDHGGLEVGWEDSGQAIDGHLDVLLTTRKLLAFVCFAPTDTAFLTFFMSKFA